MKMVNAILAIFIIALCCGAASAANTASLEKGQVIVYDQSTHERWYAYGEPDVSGSYDILVNQNGYAYAGGSAGFLVINLARVEPVYQEPGAGSAGHVQSIVVDGRYCYVGFEDVIRILDMKVPAEPMQVARIELPYMPQDVTLKRSILYTERYKYDVSDVRNPRCLNPGAQLLVFDGKGTWATERVASYYPATVVGFGWSGVEPVAGDWNGDGFEEVGIYNRAGSNFLIPSDNEVGYEVIGLGWTGVTPVTGDFDGDGDDDVGVFDNKGTWALSTDNGFKIVGFGWAGVEPVIGDWNGDGTDEVGIYNRAGNNFLVPKKSSYEIIGLGWKGVVTLVGNFDTDKSDEVCVYDPTTSTFAIQGEKPFSYGVKRSQPIVGDVNFDGVVEVGVCMPDGIIRYDIAEYYGNVEVQKWKGATLIAV